MLKKNLKLPANEIVNIARKGKKYSTEFFDVKVWWDSNLESPQFAISISKKIDARAVIRNKIKRKLKAAIMDLGKGNVKKGKYLVLVRSAALAETSQDVIKSMLADIIIIR